jgi:hypothetical protein
VFEIERIFPNSAVQCNDESLWQLSQNHIVLNVIHVSGGYRVHFYLYSWSFQEKIDGPKQVGTNDGKTTFGFVLSRQILTQPRGSEN